MSTLIQTSKLTTSFNSVIDKINEQILAVASDDVKNLTVLISQIEKLSVVVQNPNIHTLDDFIQSVNAIHSLSVQTGNAGTSVIYDSNSNVVTIPKGDTGSRGPQGVKGNTGPQGPQGVKGNTGLTGPQGLKGDTGPQGLKGDTGPQGLAGSDGLNSDILLSANQTFTGINNYTTQTNQRYLNLGNTTLSNVNNCDGIEPKHILEISMNNLTDDNQNQMVRFNTYGANGEVYQNNMHWCRYGGTQDSPSQALAGSYFMSMGFRAFMSNGRLSGSTLAFQAQTTEDYTTSNQGAKFVFQATKTGSNTRNTVLEVTGDGINVIGTILNNGNPVGGGSSSVDCYGYATASSGGSVDGNSPLKFDSLELSKNCTFSASDGSFTVNTSGVFSVTADVGLNDTTPVSASWGVCVNGSNRTHRSYTISTDDRYTNTSITALVSANSGDKIQIFNTSVESGQTYYGVSNLDGRMTAFSFHRVGSL